MGGRIRAAAGAGQVTTTNLLILGADGAVWLWQAAAPGYAQRVEQLTSHADAVAMTADGVIAVTVDATTATLWDIGAPLPSARATLSFDQPVTTLSFAPGTGRVLAAGHPNGQVSVYTIDLDRGRSTKRTLTSSAGPVTAVAVSADASTVVGSES